MNFHLAFNPRPFSTKINHRQKVLLMGSCFTENMGTKLKHHKFGVFENPNGILFNPISITKSLNSYLAPKKYIDADLFWQNESWNSWEHHSRFSNPDKEQCLNNINQAQQQVNQFLKSADWLIITLGSAFAYSIKSNFNLNTAGNAGDIVANCHKVPTDKFNKILLPINEIIAALEQSINALLLFNPSIKIIFTISPVRHIREGLVENNRSKALLILAVHQLVESFGNVFYFPAYELVIDDLRDYRFYAEDLVHPNYAATNYVWDKFISTCVDEPTQKIMKEINEINAAKSHKAFNPASEQHKKFLLINFEKVKALSNQYPYINFEEEMAFFTS